MTAQSIHLFELRTSIVLLIEVSTICSQSLKDKYFIKYIKLFVSCVFKMFTHSLTKLSLTYRT